MSEVPLYLPTVQLLRVVPDHRLLLLTAPKWGGGGWGWLEGGARFALSRGVVVSRGVVSAAPRGRQFAGCLSPIARS